MSRSQVALLAGPAFFIVWFIGATLMWSATGGESQATRSEFSEVLLSNQSSAYAGATLLVLAGALLLWFAAGIRDRIRPGHGIGLVSALGTAAVAMLLIIQGGLVIEAVSMAEEAPDVSWTVYQLSGALGYESFMTALIGGATLIGFITAANNRITPSWFLWLSAAVAAVLIAGGTMEGLGITPDGRFAIFFGLWVFVAGVTLSINASKEEMPRP
jgi:hypothetical protein